MIFFSKLGSLGRLGNQLFQYAALKGLCLSNGYRAVIPDIGNRECHGQRCLLGEFNIDADLYDGERIRRVYKERSWRSVDKRFYKIKSGTDLYGYFQSIYYFKDHQDEIKRELTPAQKYIDRNADFVNDLRVGGYEVVSVHLRRGDNMTWKNSHHYKPAYETDGAYFRYFVNAKAVFRHRKVVFLIFTGGSRGDEDNTSDIEWCKNMFHGREFVYSEGEKPMDDFTKIMLCDHNILSHVSSFGWWAAYLNGNKDRITVAPESYHPEEPSLKRYMFYPENYILA